MNNSLWTCQLLVDYSFPSEEALQELGRRATVLLDEQLAKGYEVAAPAEVHADADFMGNMTRYTLTVRLQAVSMEHRPAKDGDGFPVPSWGVRPTPDMGLERARSPLTAPEGPNWDSATPETAESR